MKLTMTAKTMKRIFLAFSLLLLLVASAFAETILEQNEGGEVVLAQEMTWSANATDNLSGRLSSGYLYQVAIKTTLDESVTFTITDCYGVPLFSGTWTTATTGEAPKLPGAFYYIPKGCRCTGTLAGLGSGTAKVVISLVKK